MKIKFKEKEIQRPCLRKGDIIVLKLDSSFESPFLVIGVDRGNAVSMVNLNTFEEGVRFKKPSLGHLSDYIEQECKMGECEIVKIVRSQNIEMREI